MKGIWKISAHGGRELIEAALDASDREDQWEAEMTVSLATAPEGGILEVLLPREPDEADIAAVRRLFGSDPPDLAIEKLPETDWVAESQRGLEPVRAGRFHVRTPDHPRSQEPGVVDFSIPASQAFGTGQHETTAGCLAMLDEMKRRGVVVRNCADIGTGTGLLAFAALALWPYALATATDLDPVCANVVIENAALNGVVPGANPGQVLVVIADGMDHALIEARAPFDLVMANILAGPLIELAPSFADALEPGGHLILAGLLATQEREVRAACFLAGLRLAARLTNGDWSILWLRRRSAR